MGCCRQDEKHLSCLGIVFNRLWIINLGQFLYYWEILDKDNISIIIMSNTIIKIVYFAYLAPNIWQSIVTEQLDALQHLDLHLWTIKTAQVPFKFKGNVADIWVNRHAKRADLTFIIPNKILRIFLVLLDILWPRSGHKILKVYIYRTENDTCVICGTIKVKSSSVYMKGQQIYILVLLWMIMNWLNYGNCYLVNTLRSW